MQFFTSVLQLPVLGKYPQPRCSSTRSPVVLGSAALSPPRRAALRSTGRRAKEPRARRANATRDPTGTGSGGQRAGSRAPRRRLAAGRGGAGRAGGAARGHADPGAAAAAAAAPPSCLPAVRRGRSAPQPWAMGGCRPTAAPTTAPEVAGRRRRRPGAVRCPPSCCRSSGRRA